MKKIKSVLVVALTLLTMFAGAQASPTAVPMINPNTWINGGATVSYTLDTVNNTTAEGPVTRRLGGFNSVSSFQITFTKISGTIAGTVILQGSNDGVTYGNVGTSHTNTDIASQTWVDTDSPKHYLYYKWLITPTGTMSASYKANSWVNTQ